MTQPIRGRLEPGYHIVRPGASRGGRPAICFEALVAEACPLRIEPQYGGTMLVRLRAPVRCSLDAGDAAGGEAPAVRCFELSPPAAALLKLAKRNRLKHRITLPDGAGYICILDGIVPYERLPELRRHAEEQRVQWALRLAEQRALRELRLAEQRALRELRLAEQRALWPLHLDDLSVPPALVDDPLPRLSALEKRPFVAKGGIGVVLHLYYAELWPEFAAFLRQITAPFDLWITHCALDGSLQEQIRHDFPQAKFAKVENRGRDIWPFIALLNEGALDRYEYICKLHSKKSVYEPYQEENPLGKRWRRRALYDLLAAGRAGEIVRMFDSDPNLGIVGPRALRMPNARVTADTAWGTKQNREIAQGLATRIGAEMRDEDLDFFAGSMFWIRRKALEPMRRLDLQPVDFPEEKGQRDGELQHALERLFSALAIRCGLKIGDLAPFEIEPAANG